jgi:hypothetical protein
VADSNRALFESVVRLLVPVLDELVFVGGCTTGLFITDSAAGGIRPTRDVDAIVACAARRLHHIRVGGRRAASSTRPVSLRRFARLAGPEARAIAEGVNGDERECQATPSRRLGRGHQRPARHGESAS